MCEKVYMISIVILCLSLDNAHQYLITKRHRNLDETLYDRIIFSQRWPATVCKVWTQNDSPLRHCHFPAERDRWTVHGIWPTMLNELRPEFCNDSLPYNLNEIKSIEEDLEQVWTQIEVEGFDLWGHEWKKHGTCGTDLEPLKTQLDYFSKGIEWNREYSLSDILSAAEIFPSDTRLLTPQELGNAVKSKTKKEPMIACAAVDDIQCLYELRICFDKNLTIIDCDPLVFFTCNVAKGIIYPKLA